MGRKKQIVLFSLLIFSLLVYPNEMPLTKNVGYYILAPSGISLREKPNLKSKKIEVIPYNHKITIIEVTNYKTTISGISSKWIKTVYKNKIGYIFAGFLSRCKGPKLNSKSLKDYILYNYGKLPKAVLKHSKSSRDSEGFLEEKKYIINDNITYTEFTAYESTGSRINFKNSSFQEVFLLMICLDTRYKNKTMKFREGYSSRKIIVEYATKELEELSECILHFFDMVTIYQEKDGSITIKTPIGC